MPETVNTGGGTFVGDKVEAGTFIGRDQIIVLSGYTAEQLDALLPRLREWLANPMADLQADVAQARLTLTVPGAPRLTLSEQAAESLLPAAARQADESAYRAALLVNPRYGRWAHQFVPLAGILTTQDHPPGWADIPPEFTELEMIGQGAQRQVRRVRLQDITQAIDRHSTLVLLGEPGSGKTTTLYRLLLDVARRGLSGNSDALPILLPLADYRDYSSPYAFLEAKWKQALGTPNLTERLRQGKLFLLCDALNEMPASDGQDYRARVGAWRRFVQDWPGNRIIFTCRSRDYSEPMGLPQVEIERLDDERVQDFLQRYLSAELAGQTWKKLTGSPLLTLVRNPYYLSMLAYLLLRGGSWPASRADLFNGFVKTLLKREQQRQHSDWLGEHALHKALAALAETMQALGEGTRLPRREALQRLPEQVITEDGPVVTPPSTLLRLGLAATLLDTELSPAGEEQIRFYHHQLQDYFSACALLARFGQSEDLSQRWRQPQFIDEMPDPGPLRDDEPLPPLPATGWEEPTLLAAGLAPDRVAFIATVRQVNPVLAARCLTEVGSAGEPVVEAVQRDLLAAMGDRRVHLRARLVAGEVLGQLGDPRFEAIEVNGQRVLLPPLVTIPGGPFQMGSSRWEIWRLARRGLTWAVNERPRHRVDLPEFFIGQYPVTNAEFTCFIAAGGYQDERWWTTEPARRWRRSESVGGAFEEILDAWRAVKADPSLPRRWGWSSYSISIWERLITLDEERFRELMAKQEADRPRDRPAYWDDERFSNPSQPVVGVTWFEARAYCAWLEAQWRSVDSGCRSVRLPTEAEWEKAARTPANGRYPWGKHWASECANTVEGHLLRTTPVGIYPGGATALGVHDLSGNVWEWTLSLYRPYRYQPGDGRNDPEAEGQRVVRGGSWGGGRGDARCAYRGRVRPGGFGGGRGFRGVVSLANSEC